MTSEKTLLGLEDKDIAEEWLNKPVLCCGNGMVGLLVAIYEDKYETTAGFTDQIDVSEQFIHGLVTFNAEYATYLPVEWKKMRWQFPTKEIGKLDLDFRSTRPYIDEKGFQHSWVLSTEPLIKEGEMNG